MKQKTQACLLALLLASLPLSAAMQVESLDLHLALASMKDAGAPRIIDEFLVLSAKGPYRYVAAAFESEGYTQTHPFDRNLQGVFILAVPVPLKCSNPIAYRLVIDGVWTIDPWNPLRAESRGGFEVSLARVPWLTDERPGLYRILAEDGKTARFLYKGEAGMLVTVAGTFDNWDPFLYEMHETRPGSYELVLPLPAGRHYYAFFYDGEAHPDPLNQERATSQDGTVVSVLHVQPKK